MSKQDEVPGTPEPENTIVEPETVTEKETATEAPEEETADVISKADAQADVLSFLSDKGIIHSDAINVRHNKEDVSAVIAHLKMTGKIGGDAMGRVWLA